MVFGIFLAWETRNIEIKALNDSKYIGISVYNVVILSVVGVILATLMSGSAYYNVYLALMSVVVILCTAATLGIVFVPKVSVTLFLLFDNFRFFAVHCLTDHPLDLYFYTMLIYIT